MALTKVASTLTKSSNAIEIYKGQSKDLQVTILESGLLPRTGLPGDVPVDLTGADIYFSVRHRPGDPTLLISKNSEDDTQITIETPAICGICTIHLDPTDTYKLEADHYVFDVWAVLSSGKTYPVIEVSEFIVKEPVTVILD